MWAELGDIIQKNTILFVVIASILGAFILFFGKRILGIIGKSLGKSSIDNEVLDNMLKSSQESAERMFKMALEYKDINPAIIEKLSHIERQTNFIVSKIEHFEPKKL